MLCPYDSIGVHFRDQAHLHSYGLHLDFNRLEMRFNIRAAA